MILAAHAAADPNFDLSGEGSCGEEAAPPLGVTLEDAHGSGRPVLVSQGARLRLGAPGRGRGGMRALTRVVGTIDSCAVVASTTRSTPRSIRPAHRRRGF